jgi:hypothetical protein
MINKIWKINKINYLTLTSSLCLLSTFLILYWVLKFSAYGIDFTDEGYYLNWMSDPFLYKSSVSKFGYIYHPLYILVDGNITWLRRINSIIIFGLSLILAYLLITKIYNNNQKNKVVLFIISCGISVSSLNVINIQTPSYNDLNFQGLLITSIGILLIDKINLNKNVLAYIFIGLGGWLTFMAKPSSALGLGMITLIYLTLSKQLQLRYLLISILTSFILLIISALLIDGSIILFFKRYIFSLELRKLMQSSYGIDKIFRLDNFGLTYKIKFSIFFIFLILMFVIWFEYKNHKLKNFFLIIITFLILVFTTMIIKTSIEFIPQFGRYRNYQIFGVIGACVFTGVYCIISNKIKITDIQWSLIILLIALPYVYAMGTGNNYWLIAGKVSFFWLLMGITVVIPTYFNFKRLQFLITIALISHLVTSLNIKERMEKPYRYNEPLRLAKSEIYTTNKHALKISDEFSRYIEDARKITNQSGFKTNTPVIDLSGQSPGLLYLIGAKSIGRAWTIGGYKGSLQRAKAEYKLVNCNDLANSWVIYEKDGPRRISTNLLASVGAKFPDQYQFMGSWQTAKGAGGYKKARTQQLYKPIKTNLILNNCNKIRKKEN